VKKDNIAIIQEAIMEEIVRLNDNELMAKNGKDEIARASAISQTSMAFLKSVALKLSIVKAVNGSEDKQTKLSKCVGVISEK